MNVLKISSDRMTFQIFCYYSAWARLPKSNHDDEQKKCILLIFSNQIKHKIITST